MFGGGVKLGQLSDYLDSNQECIKPLLGEGGKLTTEKAAASASTSSKNGGQAGKNVVYDLSRGMATERPDLIKKTPNNDVDKSSSTTSANDNKPLTKKEKAVVALSDCLACSGCVTSAEAVLLETQSFDQFQTLLKHGRDGESSTSLDEGVVGGGERGQQDEKPAPSTASTSSCSVSGSGYGVRHAPCFAAGSSHETGQLLRGSIPETLCSRWETLEGCPTSE